MADRPEVRKGEWITIGNPQSSHAQVGLVMDIFNDGTLGVGYYQNRRKAIKSDVIWNGEYWEFKYPGPEGLYLSGVEERRVKEGPPRRT
jgi:hypothetical protein